MKLPAANDMTQEVCQISRRAVLFVPFWRMANHVGNNRVDRFRRWLSEDGYEVVIVCAGAQAEIRSKPWGREISVVDRLGLHPEAAPGQAKAVSPRKPNKLRRALAYWLFNPDPAVVWAKAAAKDMRVQQAVQGASFILSSSPPESAHVGAWFLSQQAGVPHIMDMRDGWLDEPLKPILHTSVLRRWQEKRLESQIALDAKAIQVTSDVWKELFVARYPLMAHKLNVLTNAYPLQMPPSPKRMKTHDEEILLIHAGRFTGSHLSRKPDLLIKPLLENLSYSRSKGVIRFYGDLADDEIACIQGYQLQLNAIGWRVEFAGSVPRIEMLAALQQADGLLLLSASRAALPSKMFEYLATGLPIGYVADVDSATDKILRKVEMALDIRSESLIDLIKSNRVRSFRPPAEHSETELKKVFMDTLRNLR